MADPPYLQRRLGSRKAAAVVNLWNASRVLPAEAGSHGMWRTLSSIRPGSSRPERKPEGETSEASARGPQRRDAREYARGATPPRPVQPREAPASPIQAGRRSGFERPHWNGDGSWVEILPNRLRSHLQKDLMEIICGADKSDPLSGGRCPGAVVRGRGPGSGPSRSRTWGGRRRFQLIRRDFNPRPRASRPDRGPRITDYDAVSPGLSTSTSTPAGSTRCLRRSGVPVSSGNVP